MPIAVYSIALLGMFLALILFVFFLTTPKGHKQGNRILAALILVFGFQVFIALALGNYGYRHFIRPHLYLYALKLTCFASAPLIYHYVKTIIHKNRSVKIHLIHFVPFIFSLAFFGYYRFEVSVIGRTSVFIHALCLLQNLAYILFSLHEIKKSPMPVKSILIDVRDLPLVNWMRMVVLGYITLWIVQLNSLSVYVILRQPGWCAYTSSIFMLMILVFTLCIMFLLLLKPDIHYAVKYRNNLLDEPSKEEYMQKLNDYLNLGKAYLNPEISLEKAAGDIAVHPRVLSQFINEFYNMNFKGFVNDFRIRECIRLFSEDRRDERTIQEVYYMAGFNSKSVFNELFKARTGLTPREFKEKLKTGRSA